MEGAICRVMAALLSCPALGSVAHEDFVAGALDELDLVTFSLSKGRCPDSFLNTLNCL